MSPGRCQFNNYAGLGKHHPKDVDRNLTLELVTAGIEPQPMPESFREKQGGECYTVVIGQLYGWTFRRAWYYWMAEGPGVPAQYAMELFKHHGSDVRVGGHAGSPSPLEYAQGFPITHYHIDTQDGLSALAEVIRRIKAAGDALLAQQSGS
jgi:hypothetical protein